MASIAGAPNALEMRLSELEVLGLGRPANVLFSEYVTVLVARGVIDAATAERMSFGFYAAHYGDLNTEDPGFPETIVRLEDVTTRLAAMPVDARLELSERVQRDLRTISENVARSTITKEPIAAEPACEAPPLAEADGLWDAEPPSNEFADERSVLSVAVRRRRRRRLNLLIPAAFGLFFAGYASGKLIDQSVDPGGKGVGSPQATREEPKVVERQPPKETILRNWAVTEAGLKHNQKASLAYELLLAYRPEDALTLNNLAWLYLTTKDPAVHNSQRGLELALRAVSRQRTAYILDTAAEAYFQTGHPEEALKLEYEALLDAPQFGRFQWMELDPHLRRQVAKFSAASKRRPPSASSPSAGAGAAPSNQVAPLTGT